MSTSVDRVTFPLAAGDELRLSTPLQHRNATSTDGMLIFTVVLPPQSATAHGGSSLLPVAEVFGWEVPLGVPVRVPLGRSIAVLAHTAVNVLVEAQPHLIRNNCVRVVAKDTEPYRREVLAMHHRIELERQRAQGQGIDGVGPRVLIAGSVAAAGRSTLCRTLANYSVRLGYHPLYVDMDLACPQMGYPSCINVYLLQRTIDVEEESSGLPGLHVAYGDVSPSANPPLWRHSLQQASRAILNRCARNPRTRVGGVWIDYPLMDEDEVRENIVSAAQPMTEFAGGPAEDAEHSRNPIDLLLGTAEILEADVIVVVGSDWLRSQIAKCAESRLGASRSLAVRAGFDTAATEADSALNAAPSVFVGSTAVKGGGAFRSQPSPEHSVLLPHTPDTIHLRDGSALSLIPFPVSTAGFPRDALQKDFARKQRWLEYFFGTSTTPLRPSLVEVAADSCRLVQVGGISTSSMQGLLPLDEDSSKLDPAVVSYVQSTDMNLVGQILAVSNAMFSRLAPKPASSSSSTNDIESTTSRELMGGIADEGMLWEDLPITAVERKVKELTVLGFALVRQTTHKTLSLLLPGPQLPQSRGCCLIITNTRLTTSTAPQ